MAYFRCTGNSGGSLKLRTAQGEIASFETNLPEPLQSVKCEINAKQDLHGYDHPWTAGGGKNLLNYDVWKTLGVIHGTTVWENNGVTLTATDNDCFTNYGAGAFGDAKVYVTEGEHIFLSWQENENKAGKIYIFPNGSEAGLVRANNTEAKELEYIVPANVSFITFRFGVDLAGTTISYKNIQINKGAKEDAWTPYANICPIFGHSKLNLTRCGANFTDISDNTISGAGYVIGGFPVAINTDNLVLPSGNYVFSFNLTGATYPCACQLIWYRNGVEVGNTVETISASGINSIAFTASGEFDSFVMFCNSSSGGEFTNFNLNIGSTPSSYEPYNGQTFTVAFGQTVYGGVYDKSGRLTITHAIVDLGTLGWGVQGSGTDGGHVFAAFGIDRAANANGLCSAMEVKNFSSWSQTLIDTVNLGHSVVPIFASSATITDKNDFKTAMSGVMLAYELATPIVIDVQAISVSAENGVNNIVSDCGGDVGVSYLELIRGT